MSELTKRIESTDLSRFDESVHVLKLLLAELSRAHDETRRRVEALEQRAEQDGRAVNCECNVSDLPCPVHPTAPPTLTDRLRQIGDTLCNLTHEVRMLNVDAARVPIASSGGETQPSAVSAEVMDACDRIKAYARTLVQPCKHCDPDVGYVCCECGVLSDAELLACYIRDSAAPVAAGPEVGDNEVDGLRESLRIANERIRELEGGFLKVHQLIEPGADWYSWQRVYQNAERVLKAADVLAQCLMIYPSANYEGAEKALDEYAATRFREPVPAKPAPPASPPPGECPACHGMCGPEGSSLCARCGGRGVEPAPLPPPGETGKYDERTVKAAIDKICETTAYKIMRVDFCRQITDAAWSLIGKPLPVEAKPN